MTPAQALIDAAEDYMNGSDSGLNFSERVERRRPLYAAIVAAKAAEEGVETKYRLEWYSNVSDSWVPDFHIDRDKELIDKRMAECTAGTNKLRMIQKDTYTSVIEVREKEGL